MADNDGIPHLDIEIDESDLLSGVKKVVELLQPEWNKEDLIVKSLSTGYVNKNYSVQASPGQHPGLFIRLVNTQIPYILEAATKASRYLKRRGIGAQLLMTFRNGLVIELLQGGSITWDTFYLIKEPKTWLGVAKSLATYHGTTNFDDIKELDIMDHHVMTKMMRGSLEGTITAMGIDMKKLGLPTVPELFKLREKVYDSLIEDGAEFGFCHIDPNPTNVILTDEGPVFVDNDFCSQNCFCVELASFFTSVCNMTKTDFNDYPTEEEKDTFIREYLKCRAEIDPKFGRVGDEMVKYWKFLVKKATLAIYLGGIATVVMLQQMGTKSTDMGIADWFWNKYREGEKILYMKYKKGK